MNIKCKISTLIPSIVIALTCIIFHLFSINEQCSLHSALHCKLFNIFSHSNIFHLIVNLIALFQFRPRIKTCLIAYIVSVVVVFIPLAHMDMPTCGLSGFLMACYARRYYAWKLSVKWLLLSNLMLAFIPVFNWKVHLLCFIISYLTYGSLSYIRTHRRG